MSTPLTTETFTPDEARALAPYFTNTDRPVFALTNLPETVKGALFARYSRSAKSLRRLFLDEFLGDVARGIRRTAAAAPAPRPAAAVGTARADKLYARVLNEYGDDSVAQLGGAHLACEGVSNVLTKVLEWGRLMAYLEQSTRYVPYTDRPNGRWKYHVPAELDGSPLRDRFVRTLDTAFDTYARWIPALEAHFRAKYPKTRRRFRRRLPVGHPREGARHAARAAAGGDDVQRRAVRDRPGVRSAAAADVRASARARCARMRELMLAELRQVIPAFLARVDQPNRGGRWIEYLAETRRGFDAAARGLLADLPAAASEEVTLTDFDPDGEMKVVAAALYAHSALPDEQLLALARAAVSRRSRRAAQGLRRRARQPAPQARTGVRAHAATGSTCWPTTARSAICSAIGC